jgi:HPt (histidine-containing phosphotransfer) domain-containing protein
MDKDGKEDLTVEQQIANDLAALWKEYKTVIFDQMAVIQAASLAVGDQTLTPELRERAATEAHKLAGSVGSFGFTEGSLRAAEIERVFRAAGAIEGPPALRLAECVEQLLKELEKDEPGDS